jgi:LPXTG-site transpeptidase (sortase) family protein
MNIQPPASNDDQSDTEAESYLLPKKEAKVNPLSTTAERNAATVMIRQKLNKIYDNEPSAEEELEDVMIIKPNSKHQDFMHELSTSGKSLAEIQTEWHHYYVTLPDAEKHEVWKEFYARNTASSKYHKQKNAKPKISAPEIESALESSGVVTAKAEPKMLAIHAAPSRPKQKLKDARTPKQVKKAVLDKVSAGGKLKAKHHFQSLLFGLGLGFTVIFIFLFGFFNEFFIAPFIQPSRNASATPLILNSSGVAPTPNPEVIIPSINVEIPVNYTETSTNEDTIENDLQDGVVHYPTTVMPGEKGNTAFFGHSSNNIFNKGKYKFAFVLLHTLVPGDTFYLTNNNKVYVYKVISKDIVDPSDVAVLGPVAGQTATATLITCDPPGTSLHRLIIVGQQISPDPSGNATSTTPQSSNSNVVSPAQLPGNGPTAWSRFWNWLL